MSIAEAFARARIVESHRIIDESYCLEKIERSLADALESFYRLLKRQADRALPREIVDFVGCRFSHHLKHAPEIGYGHRLQVNAILDAEVCEVGELRDLRVARRSVHFVLAREKELREVRAVLSRYSADQCSFQRGYRLMIVLLITMTSMRVRKKQSSACSGVSTM